MVRVASRVWLCCLSHDLDLYYIFARSTEDLRVRSFIGHALSIFTVAPVGTPEAKHALLMPIRDFEDAMQASAALAIGVDAIVTRDAADFAGATVWCLTPEQFLAIAPK